MRSSNILAIRSLIAKINPHSALTTQESTRLLNILKSSFNSQLDKAHADQPSSKLIGRAQNHERVRDHKPRNNAHVATNKHLANILSNFAFSTTLHTICEKEAFVEQQLRRLPASDVLEDLLTSGMSDPALATLCFKAHWQHLKQLSPFQRMHDVRESRAGTRAFAWLLTTDTGCLRPCLPYTKHDFVYVAMLLALENKDHELWNCLDKTALSSECRFASPISPVVVGQALNQMVRTHVTSSAENALSNAMISLHRALSLKSSLRPPRSAFVRPEKQVLDAICCASSLPDSPQLMALFEALMRDFEQQKNEHAFSIMRLFHPVSPSVELALHHRMNMNDSDTPLDFAKKSVRRSDQRLVAILLAEGQTLDADRVVEHVRRQSSLAGKDHADSARARHVNELERIIQRHAESKASIRGSQYGAEYVPG